MRALTELSLSPASIVLTCFVTVVAYAANTSVNAQPPFPQTSQADISAYVHHGRSTSRGRVKTSTSDTHPRHAKASTAQGQFIEAPEYATVYAPAQMASGDFNGDGIPDLVTGSFGSTIGVLLGKGDGTFAPVIPVEMKDNMGDNGSPAHWAVATGDLNGDGLDDIVVSSIESAHLTVFLSDGDGTFTLLERLYGVTSFGLKLADVNGDGKLDVVAAEYGLDGENGSVAVLLGNGDGTFQKRHNYQAGIHPGMVAVGDLNGDGKLDLVIANSGDNVAHTADTISVLLGRGDGIFLPKTDYTVGLHPQSVTVADLNRDGKLDVIAANLYDSTVTVLLGLGNGLLGAGTTFSTGLGPVEVVVGDVNGDGKPDLITVNDAYTNSSVLLGNGHGSFSKHQEYGAGEISFGIAVADFNADGKLDIAISNDMADSVSIQIGLGNGTFWAHREYEVGTGVSTVATIHDGNRKPSVAVGIACGDGRCTQPGYVQIMHPAGKNGFAPGEIYAGTGQTQWIAVADFNGDGVDDIVDANWPVNSSRTGAGVSVLLRDSSGNAVRKDYVVPGNPTLVQVADFNGDGKPDFATANTGGTKSLSVFLNNGNGTFRRHDYSGPGYQISEALAVGDLNGDGKQDIVISDFFDGLISIFYGKGDGTFQPRADFFLPAGAYPIGIALGDFNHDGVTDVAVADGFNDYVYVMLGTGGGGLQLPVAYLAGGLPYAMTVADVDNDGNSDLVVSDRGDGHVEIFYGVGDGTFLPRQAFAAGGSPVDAVAVDLNGDGFKDLVVAPSGPDLVVLKNTGQRGVQ